MSNYEVQMIEIATISAGDFERPLDAEHAAALARDIHEHDLHQPIGLIRRAEGLTRCWGQHRCEAFRILGKTHIPARIVDEHADELMFSLAENHLHLEESLEAMVTRVTALARRHQCTFHDAALQANVKPSKFSRCKKIVDKLSDAAKQFAAAHDLGMSDLYLVATRAATPEMQLEALQARVNGISRDGLLDWFDKRRDQQVKPKPHKKRAHKIALKELNADVQLSLPAEFDLKFIAELVRQLKSQLHAIRKQSQTPPRSTRRRARSI